MQRRRIGPTAGPRAEHALEIGVHALLPLSDPHLHIWRNLLCVGFDAGFHQWLSEFLFISNIEKCSLQQTLWDVAVTLATNLRMSGD